LLRRPQRPKPSSPTPVSRVLRLWTATSSPSQRKPPSSSDCCQWARAPPQVPLAPPRSPKPTPSLREAIHDTSTPASDRSAHDHSCPPGRAAVVGDHLALAQPGSVPPDLGGAPA